MLPIFVITVAMIALLLKWGGIAAGAIAIAEFLFFIFLVLFFVSLAMGVHRRDSA
jgi:uncharacterized membrane protein YtjA (UPF0391 family)